MDIKKSKGLMVLVLLLVFHTTLCQEDYDDDEIRPTWGRCPWIRNKLKFGRVKIRSRGRIAKFLCNSGYEMVGKRFATCVRGEWNNPLPVCINKGCYKITEPVNGKVVETYKGAMMQFDCFPGYTLKGSAVLYCDGIHWSDAAPICDVAIVDPETFCDFEDPDLCGWTNDPSHNFDWRRNQFGTPSGHVGTGPSFDHTFGNGKAGFYLYQEASSPRKENDKSRLFSPVFSSLHSPGCFLFWYHMYGATVGGLRVYIKPESYVFGELTPSWEKFGDQGNHWIRGNLSIPYLVENFQLIIEGIRGSSYVGDTAIDDVSLLQTECSALESTNSSTTAASQDSCRGRCQEQVEVPACECVEQCLSTNTCCTDYSKMCTTGNDTFVVGDETPEHVVPTEEVIPTTELQTIGSQATIKQQTNSQTSTLSVTSAPILTEKPTTMYSSTVRTSFTTPFITSVSTSVPTTDGPSSRQTLPRTEIVTQILKTQARTEITTTVPKIIVYTTRKQTTAEEYAKTKSSVPRSTFMTTNATLSQFPQTQTSKKDSTYGTMTAMTSQASTTKKTITVVIEPRTINSLAVTSIDIMNVTATDSVKDSPTTFKTPFSDVRPLTSIETREQRLPSTNKMTSPSAIFTQTPITTSDTSPAIGFNYSVTKSSADELSTNAGTTIELTKINSSTTVSSSILSSAKFLDYDTLKPRQRTMFYTRRTVPPKAVSTIKPKRITETTMRQMHTEKTYTSTLSPNLHLKERKDSLHPSKSETRTVVDSSPSVAGVTVGILVCVCIVGGLGYFLYRRKNEKLKRLSEDSEIRFLSQNEELEFSDSTAFERMVAG